MATWRQAMVVLAAEIPREAQGYAADLLALTLAPQVEADRLARLERYVPGIVAAWEIAGGQPPEEDCGPPCHCDED